MHLVEYTNPKERIEVSRMTWFNVDGAFDSIGIHVSAKRGLKRKRKTEV